jgi:hypothetical protein
VRCLSVRRDYLPINPAGKVTPIYVDGIYVDGIYIGSLERREKVSGCVATTERRTWTSEASIWCKPEPFWYHEGMAMTLRLPAEIEDQLKQAAESEHRSVQQTVLLAIEEYLSARETGRSSPTRPGSAAWPRPWSPSGLATWSTGLRPPALCFLNASGDPGPL